MQLDDIKILPKFSLEPNKVSMYNEVLFAQELENEVKKIGFRRKKSSVTRQFHNFKISDNAYRNLKRKINWLYFLAKKKRVTTYSGKTIFNFKIAFITLTLPSKQKHPTSFITKELYNQFLTEVRQRTKMENYVWRLEFQKNGNVHYHLVTDTYLDYFLARKIWNRILQKHGYIQEYREKFRLVSLREYNDITNSDRKTDFKTVAKRYARGCKEDWSNPNSVDVKSVVSDKSIANYISKYFAKDSSDNSICNELDNEENSKSLRLWFCSRSLSKLQSVTKYVEEVPYIIDEMLTACAKVRVHVAKWAKICYYQITDFSHFFSIHINKLLRDYAKKQGYFGKVPEYIS